MRVLLVSSGFGGWFEGFERAVASALAAHAALVVRVPADQPDGPVASAARWDLTWSSPTNRRPWRSIRPGGLPILPWCTDPDAFSPAPGPTGALPRRTIDVLFVGQGFPNRVRVLNRLAPWLARWKTALVGDFERWGEKLHETLRPCVGPPARGWAELARLYQISEDLRQLAPGALGWRHP